MQGHTWDLRAATESELRLERKGGTWSTLPSLRAVVLPLRSLSFVLRAALTVLCVVLACGRVGAAENPLPSVGVDFSTLDAATYREIDGLPLEKAALLRLVQ